MNGSSLLLLVLVAIVAAVSAQVNDPVAIKSIKDLEKYCPYYGFDGVLQCPSGPKKQNPSSVNTHIRSGLGFDRVKRSIRFPVLPTNAPTPVPGATYAQAYDFKSGAEYLNYVFAAKESAFGGVFILDDNWVSKFASMFNDFRVKIGMTQKEYVYYSTSVASRAPINEFVGLLSTLPKTYNPSNGTEVHLYRTRLIEVFGTDVTIASNHGGVFFQQTAVKSCYGGSITDDMVKEIESNLKKEPPGPLAYLKYRSLGAFDVKGGNPELPRDRIPEIIASFAQNPAIVGFTLVPLWQVVPAEYQAAVKAAIDHYTAEKQNAINALAAQIEQAKIAAYRGPQTVFVYARQTEQGGSIIRWDKCPYVKTGNSFYTPRCTFLLQNPAKEAGQTSVIVDYKYNNCKLHYETQRDAGSGDMRIFGWCRPGLMNNTEPETKTKFSVHNIDEVKDNIITALVDGMSNKDIGTPFVHSGCVNLDYFYLTKAPHHKTYFTACIDCQPIVTTTGAAHGLVHSDLQCVCPGF